MLKHFSLGIPFLLLRILVVLAEAATLYFGSLFVYGLFVDYMSTRVPSLFLTFISPMGLLIGLALSTLVVKFGWGFLQYYIKLAHIIYLTLAILEYKPYRGSRFAFALGEAFSNFNTLALNDLTTRTVIKALKALKDAIVKTDLVSKFKDTNNSFIRFFKSICTTALSNVINMTDEIIVSYTWFTNSLFMAERARKNKGELKLKEKIKTQTTFMLEGMVFTVRVLPKLMVNSLVFEVAFLFLAHAVTVGLIILFIMYYGFSWLMIFYILIAFRTLIQIFYHAVVESLRLNVYLYSFYSEVNELEPFDILETMGSIVGKVPMLGALVKKSGLKIEPSGAEGSNILDGDFNQILKDNIAEAASAFNLNTNDILDEEELNLSTEVETKKEQPKEDSQEDNTPNEVSTPEEPAVQDEEILIPSTEDDIEVELEDDTNVNPFVRQSGAQHSRR